MKLSVKLIDKLACPRCKGRLDYQESQDRLDCPACRLSYAVQDGIPVLLIDEAKSLP
jgi:uncharacterized protein